MTQFEISFKSSKLDANSITKPFFEGQGTIIGTLTTIDYWIFWPLRVSQIIYAVNSEKSLS